METLLEAAMLCKMDTRKRLTDLGETGEWRLKPSMLCVVEAHESTRTLPGNHDDHIAENGFKSLAHHILVLRLIPMHQAMKIPTATAAVEESWDKLGKIPAWQMDEVKNKRDVFLEAQKEKKKVHFATLVAFVTSKNTDLEPTAPET